MGFAEEILIRLCKSHPVNPGATLRRGHGSPKCNSVQALLYPQIFLTSYLSKAGKTLCPLHPHYKAVCN
jgi:hypothetical protein